MPLLLALALLLSLLAPAPSGVTLTAGLTDGDLVITVQTDAPRHFSMELGATGGASVNAPTIYEFDLLPGELFGRRISPYGPGAITIRVWASDGGNDPAAEQTVHLPTLRVYLPRVT